MIANDGVTLWGMQAGQVVWSDLAICCFVNSLKQVSSRHYKAITYPADCRSCGADEFSESTLCRARLGEEIIELHYLYDLQKT